GEDPRHGRPEDEDGSTGRSAPARPAQARSFPDGLGARSGYAGLARARRASRPAGPHADDGQEWSAGHRPQPAPRAPLGVVDAAGARPTAWAGPSRAPPPPA